MFSFDREIEPVMRHGDPVTLSVGRVRFPGELKAGAGVFAEFV